jgi:flagellar basal body-associated protein FliL
MKNIFGLLKKIFLTLAIILITALSIGNAYILFAPDEWPKPFYLSYRYPIVPPNEGETTSEGASHGSTTQTGSGGEAVSAAPAEASGGESGGEKTAAPVASLEIRPGQGIMIDTGTKIVNLVDPTGRKYLRSTLVLEFSPTDLAYYTMAAEEKVTYLEEFKADLNVRLPVINDIIIQMLASQTYDSVYTAEGKEQLRQKLMETINTQLPEYRVIYVYFTEFVVQ